MQVDKKRPEVVAIYCPLWHNYDHASAWKGEDWCEWELMKAATPRFAGHYQPYKPTWGCFDESDPKWSAREIGLAADNGVDVFLVDWYWYNGVKIMEEALDRGLLRARNRERVKFALMWANHDWFDYFPLPLDRKRNTWLPSRHSPQDWERVIEYCIELYFRQPHYWRVDDAIFFSIYDSLRFVRELGGAKAFRKLLAATNRRLARAKLPPLHLNAMVFSLQAEDELKAAGYASITNYNIHTSGKISTKQTERYEDVIEGHLKKWDLMAGASLPYCPVVTVGWDASPRCEKKAPWPFPPNPLNGSRDYPYMHVVVGNTPELFEELCARALRHCRETQPLPYAVFVNAWNEWTEGCILLPEKRYGTGYLKAILQAFGRKRG